MKKLLSLILCALLLLSFLPAGQAEDARSFRILFTSDMHSHLENASRLATLIKQYTTDNTVWLDGGDFSQGTLFQAGYETDACELSLLARLGCLAAVPGNHEWDHAGRGFAVMLDTAAEKNDTLPAMLLANAVFDNNPTTEQTQVRDSLLAYNKKAGYTDDPRYMLHTLPNGLTLGIFGINGKGSIEDSPTSGMNWADSATVAKEMASLLADKCDFTICLSHSGTSYDFSLLEGNPGIDFLLSGHTHALYTCAQTVGDSTLGAPGEYMQYLGVADFTVDAAGKSVCTAYKMVPITANVAEDGETAELVQEIKSEIDASYLSDYGYEYDQVIAHSSFDFISLGEMYATHGEYPMGNLIADSYRYAAEQNGINDIDVFLVGLGTVRGSIKAGDITLSDAFDICSLGVGADYSAGHPILGAYITGRELKLLVNLDATLGPMVSSIKMSYAGLRYRFNTCRVPLDQASEIMLVRPDGREEKIDDNKLYKVCANMYAANMLGMVNDLTKGILKIVIKDANGNPVSDLYTMSLKDTDGREIKEWVAFADYLSSFDVGAAGLPEIPAGYRAPEGRKVKYSEIGLDILRNPSWPTLLAIVLVLLVLALIVLIVRLIVKLVKKIVRIVRKGKKK